MPQGNLFWPFKSFGNALNPARLGQQGDAWFSSRHGTYYSAVYGTPAQTTPSVVAAVAGSVFSAANASTTTLSVGLATTYTGCCLSNPAGSGKNLIVRGGGFAVSATSAADAYGIITGWAAAGVVTHTTPVTGILNNYIGAATSGGSVLQVAPVGLVDAACTIVGTPLWSRFVAGAATSSVAGANYLFDDLFLVPPGGYIAWGGTGGSTGFWGSWTWEEVAP
jgi:hypothetical protein